MFPVTTTTTTTIIFLFPTGLLVGETGTEPLSSSDILVSGNCHSSASV
jgi:hypothetical protein